MHASVLLEVKQKKETGKCYGIPEALQERFRVFRTVLDALLGVRLMAQISQMRASGADLIDWVQGKSEGTSGNFTGSLPETTRDYQNINRAFWGVFDGLRYST